MNSLVPRSAGRLVVAVLAATALGCSTPVDREPERNVNPGINAEYLKPDLQVTQWVERFEREGREVYDNRQRIVETIGLKSGMRVADIGAGSGLFTPLLAEKVGPRGRVHAVDIVPAFLEHIQRRMDAAGLRQVQTVLCTDRSVELPPASIDVAFLCDVYHHFEYPQSSLASIHRALKPGGVLVMVEFKRIPRREQRVHPEPRPRRSGGVRGGNRRRGLSQGGGGGFPQGELRGAVPEAVTTGGNGGSGVQSRSPGQVWPLDPEHNDRTAPFPLFPPVK
jgi:SAM-dependent methyltransferase